MKIIIIGCGKIGETILSNLVSEGHDIVIVDNKPDVVDKITNIYDAMGVCGNGTDCETLAEAGVENTELFVAVTASDELNMLSCFIAKKMGASQTIARIRNPEYNSNNLGFLKQNLGLSMAINPELLAAKEMFDVLKLPSAAKVESFCRGSFEMVELKLKPDSKLDGLSLIELRKKYTEKFLIGAVQREDSVYIPDGNFVLKSGDKISISASHSELLKLFKELSITSRKSKNVMILGAGKIAFYLAKLLIAGGSNVKIIEKDLERCEQVSELLPSVVMINGDGAQQELLLEEGLGSMDAFVALTGMDEQNILISCFAASQNVGKVVCKINREEFITMAEKLGLETIISPKKTVADVVLRYARALKDSFGSSMETLYSLMDGKAEVTEFVVDNDCPIIHIPFKDLKLKANTLITGIIRNRKSIIPDGGEMLHSGDHVVILTSGHKISNLLDIVK